MPILVLFVILMVVFVLPSLFRGNPSSKKRRHTAIVRKTTHESYTGKNGEIENRYAVTVLLDDPLEPVKEYEINRKEYGLLCEGDEVVVTPKTDGYAECTLKRRQ